MVEVIYKMFNLMESSISGRSEGPGKGDVISIKCLFFFLQIQKKQEIFIDVYYLRN